MIVYIVRHGLSVANEKRLVTGTPDDILSNQGVVQVKQLKDWMELSKVNPSVFYVSQWSRAKQTAEELFPDVIWQEDIRLGETFAGQASNMMLKEFLKKNPEFYRKNDNKYPGGESHRDLNNRVVSFWDEISLKSYESIMIVTHSGPISCILQNVLGLDMNLFPVFSPPNATLTILECFSKVENEHARFKIKGFGLGPKICNI